MPDEKVDAKTKKLAEIQVQIDKLVAERDKLAGAPCVEEEAATKPTPTVERR